MSINWDIEKNTENNSIVLTGYHGTITNHRNSIETDGFDPKKITRRPDHWLGNGVYFFPNEFLATWWADTLAKRNNTNGIIYKVIVKTTIDKFIDLDNYEHLKIFYMFLLDFQKQMYEADCIKFSAKNISKVSSVIFDVFMKNNNYDIIINTFCKENTKYSGLSLSPKELKIFNSLIRNLNVYILEPQCCVFNKDCIRISEVIWLDNEVI